jgi:hypothetical protein
MSISDYIMIIWLAGLAARWYLSSRLPPSKLRTGLVWVVYALFLGGLCNIFIIVINRGMPVNGLDKSGGIHNPMNDNTLLPILGDYFRVTFGTQKIAYSIGDVLIVISSLGICLIYLLWILNNRRIRRGQYQVRF